MSERPGQERRMTPITVDGSGLTCDDVDAVARSGARIALAGT